MIVCVTSTVLKLKIELHNGYTIAHNYKDHEICIVSIHCMGEYVCSGYRYVHLTIICTIVCILYRVSTCEGQ